MTPLVRLLPILALTLAKAQAVPVIFQVDVSIQSSLGRFDPAVDVLELRGAFNGWASGTEMSADPTDAFLYRVSFDLTDPSGTTIEYKFLILADDGGETWEGDVGDGLSNRTFVLEEGGQELPPVYFDNLSVDPGAGVEVTFQVDMAARIQTGIFDPAVDIVEARGPFNSWAAGFILAPAEAGSTIYEGTIVIRTSAPGSLVPYKYIINEAEWENGDNRTFELAEATQVLPARYFDDIEPVAPVVLGPIFISTPMDGSVTVRWESPEAVLQGATALTPDSWDDIPDSTGRLEMTFSTDLAETLYFRLAAP